MGKKKLGVLLVGICLFLVLATIALTIACAKPVRPPERELKQMKLVTGTLGSTGYVLAFALAQEINKHSDWLRAAALETSATAERPLITKSPGNKKDSMFITAAATFYESREGMGAFKDKPYSFAVVANGFNSNPFLATLDPKIKTIADLAGKSVNLGQIGGGPRIVWAPIMKMMGVLDKVKITEFTEGKSKDALLSGMIDAAWFSFTGGEPNLTPQPALQEIMAARDVYSVQWPLELEAQVVKEIGYPAFYAFKKIPRAALPAPMKSDVYAYASPMFWASDWELDPEIASEVCRILYEYMKDFAVYDQAAASWSLQGFVEVPAERKTFHPAALKFWEEKGAKITYKEPQK